jgi:hypothetical protein
MTPRAATLARSEATRAVARASYAPSRPSIERPRPTLVVPEPRRSRLQRARAQLRPSVLAAGFVVVCLLAVMIGNMQLASGQLGLEQLQSQLNSVESNYAATLAQVTSEESPAALAASQHLVSASHAYQLPMVPLSRRLAPPHFSAAPCCSLTPGA